MNELLKEREEDFEKEFDNAPLSVFTIDNGVITVEIEDAKQFFKSHNKQTNKLLIEKVIEMCEGEKFPELTHEGMMTDQEHYEQSFNGGIDQIITQLRKEL